MLRTPRVSQANPSCFGDQQPGLCQEMCTLCWENRVAVAAEISSRQSSYVQTTRSCGQAWHSWWALEEKMDNLILKNREVRLPGTAIFWFSNGGECSAFISHTHPTPPRSWERRKLLGKQQSWSFPATAGLVDKEAKSPGDTSQISGGAGKLLMCSSYSRMPGGWFCFVWLGFL